jgi:ribosomal protein S19
MKKKKKEVKSNTKININKVIYERSSTIPKCFKYVTYRIHKGNDFRKLIVSKYHIGFKFGEFSFTRKPFYFPLKKKKR